jgi:GrpB-like predicted nucleotidyltransferase (UPF0157 family)
MGKDHLPTSYVNGSPKIIDGPIVLVEYDPKWPELFAKEAARIRSALGDKALLIEHVGSTPVPRLPAKPIIDILLVVANSANEVEYAPELERAGYTLLIREANWHEHRLFKGPDTDINLHVFSVGDGEIWRMLTFRDRLRSNPEDRDLYVRTKRELAKRKWKYVQDYADAKSEVVETILKKVNSPLSDQFRSA